jgi:hypothetical protein
MFIGIGIRLWKTVTSSAIIPPSTSQMLLEDNFTILLEDGTSFLMLEA